MKKTIITTAVLATSTAAVITIAAWPHQQHVQVHSTAQTQQVDTTADPTPTTDPAASTAPAAPTVSDPSTPTTTSPTPTPTTDPAPVDLHKTTMPVSKSQAITSDQYGRHSLTCTWTWSDGSTESRVTQQWVDSPMASYVPPVDGCPEWEL